jgi:hypothetical protein
VLAETGWNSELFTEALATWRRPPASVTKTVNASLNVWPTYSGDSELKKL